MPDHPYVYCAIDKEALQQILDCMKPTGPCSVKIETDIWDYPVESSAGLLMSVPEPVRYAVSDYLAESYDVASPPVQIIGVSDFCAHALFVEGGVPPECQGPIKSLVLQHARLIQR